MNRFNLIFSIILSLLPGLLGCEKKIQSSNAIWFSKPGKYFEEAFPLGNGFIGMMIKGGVPSEDIILNESSLWSGGPVDANMNPEAWKNLGPVRNALFSEKYELAQNLVKKIQGKFSDSFLPLGNLKINFDDSDSISGYRRELYMNTGIATVNYLSDNKQFHREYFVSNPDRVAVIRLKGDSPGSLNFTLFSNSLLKFKTHTENNDFIMDGLAPVHAEPVYNNVPDP